jgi:mono/diheme cytochrome c family protein
MIAIGRVFAVCGAVWAMTAGVIPARAQDLPDGQGKDVVLRVCGSCHGVDYMTNLKHSKAEWQTVVDQMIGYGATATDQEVETIVNYLTKYFGPSTPPANLDRAAPRNRLSQRNGLSYKTERASR